MRSPRSNFESSACIDMILHHKNVTEAAMDAGFADLSYFTKLFKRTKGITPPGIHEKNQTAGHPAVK